MNPEHLVDIESCQVCGSHESDELFVEPPVSVRRCGDCGLVYITPRLSGDALAEVYGEQYWQSDSPKTRGYADYVVDEPLYLKTFRRRLDLVSHHAPGELKVLDVGCAAGFFLRVMRDAGHQTYGIELSRDIAGHAQRHLGDDAIHIGTLDQLPADRSGFARGSFDLVTMWDVIEHVPDPQLLLRQARQMLKPGGTLILETQNVASRFAALLGRRWHHYKHLEHLYHFDPSTLARLFDQTGFQVVRNTPSYGGKYVSLAFIAERAGRVHRSLGFLLKPLSVLGRANLYVNLRDEMVVVARPIADPAPVLSR